MKLWVDDIRSAPEGYVWCKSVNETKTTILRAQKEQKEFIETAYRWLKAYNIQGFRGCMNMANRREIELIDLGHDAGDYIRLLDWLEETGRNYPIRIHSMNPVGVANMRAIIERNGWKEVF